MALRPEFIIAEFDSFRGAGVRTAAGARAIEGQTSTFQFSLAGDDIRATLNIASLNMLKVTQGVSEPLTPAAAAASVKSNGIA